KILKFSYVYIRVREQDSELGGLKMKTTLKYITIMATLAVFSTLSNDVMAQKTSSASMTIKATVVESTSLKSISEMIFSEADITESGYRAEMSQAAGFSINGITNTEIGISFKAPEMLT